MIHNITIENFGSIAEEQKISFRVAKNAPDLPCFVTSRADDKKRLPVAIGFFGANATGKTTVLKVIVNLKDFISYSFFLKPDASIYDFKPHLSNEWVNKPTKISIEFDCSLPNDEKEYLFKYQIIVEHNYNDSHDLGAKFVEYEALSYLPSPHANWRNIFERNKQKYNFGEEFGIEDTNPIVATIRPNASILSTLAQFNHFESLQFIKNWTKNRTNIGASLSEDEAIDKTVNFYQKNPDFLNDLNKTIRRIDVGIEKVEIDNGPSGAFFKFYHEGLNRHLFFSEESEGTNKFITLYPAIKYALDTGSIAIIDELDSVLHTTLIAEVFSWFEDKRINKNKAQLLFSAHNPSIFDLMEKEQIFITEKNNSGATEIYGLKDIKGLDREPKLSKKYLAGELGGLPYIG